MMLPILLIAAIELSQPGPPPWVLYGTMHNGEHGAEVIEVPMAGYRTEGDCQEDVTRNTEVAKQRGIELSCRANSSK